MVRNAHVKAKYSMDTLHEICGSFYRIPRLEKIEKLEWLRNNYRSFDRRLLRVHYGLFLNLLRRTVPVKPMVDFLILITDVDTVTQGRVNLVCQIYLHKMNSPSIARLLRTMSRNCRPNIYVPPLGQHTVEDAYVPLDVSLVLASGGNHHLPPEAGNLRAARLCTKIYHSLVKAAPDIELSEVMAQLVPLVEQSGRVFGAIEMFVYDYLANTWIPKQGAERTLTLTLVASSLFRFWPKDNEQVLLKRLLEPLKHARKSAIDVLVPHLWHFGSLAAPLMESMIFKGRPIKNEWYKPHVESFYMHVYQFYRWIPHTIVPPPVLVADLITRLRVYLFPCAQWSDLVPAICVTLQGEFCLVSTEESLDVIELLFDRGEPVKTLFAFANSPWLGGYPQRTFSRVKVQNNVKEGPQISSKRPASSVTVIDPTTLEAAVRMSYPDFCQQLVNDLQNVGLNIAPYLQEIQS